MAVSPEVRRGFVRGLEVAETQQVLAVAARESGSPYGLWADDPVGFIEDVLGETLWSLPRKILAAVPSARRVAVPSCFASSKSWTAARAALWFTMTRPVGTALAVTIAPQWRQVIRQLWPEIRNAHSRAGLLGTVDATQLKLPDAAGHEHVTAYGLAAPPWNETAIQGIHKASLLLIVDEAGGIGHVIGRNLRAMLTGDGTHMLAIGNPPTDDESSWFEQLCDNPDVTTIPISAYDTPNLSGEEAPRCRSCPPEMPVHSLAAHLVDKSWVDDTIRENGEDANYVIAKVFAKFPKGGPSRALPSAWVEAAAEADEPAGDEYVSLHSLDGETDGWRVAKGAWIRLGVDVAAGGGDEFVVARAVGDLVQIRHTAAGLANIHPMDVAGRVLEEIRHAERLRELLGSEAKIRVKVDGIGVGWGVAGILAAWGSEGLHGAEIVPVIVSESTDREPDAATLRPHRKRDEMWLAARSLLQPGKEGQGRLRLRIDSKTLAQMRAPTIGTTSTGHTRVESKESLKERGLSSPDRAEACLLAVYEPAPPKTRKKKARLLA
ncbi:hypothetical protein [Actinomadura violacea]|uniref:Terminase n=1 Tax=Actinomadura violacea TaxID=2819934 RepID=A0ABS3RY70_9ACTN|nr:hypothetical protein [Actinomadura violacea]MBO2461705.1 hypothetical protein [Actinomadura violacea]